MSGHEGVGRQRVYAQGTAGIETKPANPQQRRSDRRVCQVVRRHRLATKTDSRSHQQTTRQCSDTRTQMHDRSASKVQ